jgi:hypothetical protein
MTRQKSARACCALAAAFFVAGCATQPDVGSPPPMNSLPNRGRIQRVAGACRRRRARTETRVADPEEKARLFKGTGVLVKGSSPAARCLPARCRPARRRRRSFSISRPQILREVVRNILGDVLNESYTIDAAVGGQVTIRTSSGIPRDALIATLETLLRMNGAR